MQRRRYEILLPLTNNAGQPFSPDRFYQTREELIHRFGGLSAQIVQGVWVKNGARFEDQSQRIVIDVDDSVENRQFFVDFKKVLQERFEQVEIYLVTYLIERL